MEPLLAISWFFMSLFHSPSSVKSFSKWWLTIWQQHTRSADDLTINTQHVVMSQSSMHWDVSRFITCTNASVVSLFWTSCLYSLPSRLAQYYATESCFLDDSCMFLFDVFYCIAAAYRLQRWPYGSHQIYTIWHEWVNSVLRRRQHSIGYMGDGLYRSKDPTNIIKVLKEMLQKRKKTTKTTKYTYTQTIM